MWVRPGWMRGSVYWLLLVWGRFCVWETIIPDAQEHFLPLQHAATLIFSVDWGLEGVALWYWVQSFIGLQN